MLPEDSQTTPRKLRVFLCHASGDKPTVRRLYRRLREDGFEPWLDEEALIPGQLWEDEIPKAVRGSDAVVVCLSARSTDKEGYVQKEIKLALDVALEKPDGVIFLIPLKLEPCEIPQRLSPWHWVDYFEERGYEKLRQALLLRSARLPELPRAPRKLELPPPDSTPPNTAATPADPPGNQPGSSPARLPWRRMGMVAVITAVIITAYWLLPTNRPGITIKVNPADGLEYAWIPPGEFLMGAVSGDSNAIGNEQPRHPVEISKGLWLSRGPITAGAYRRFVGTASGTMPPEAFFNREWKKEDHPVVNVTWQEAKEYCGWAGGRLPTEAEWEYAARGGTGGLIYPWGNEIGPERANYRHGNRGGTSAVGMHEPNGFGLYDMAGNVFEWCADWAGEDYYKELERAGTVEDPMGPASATLRILRGGAWNDDVQNLRISLRGRVQPDHRGYNIGFRCALKGIP